MNIEHGIYKTIRKPVSSSAAQTALNAFTTTLGVAILLATLFTAWTPEQPVRKQLAGTTSFDPHASSGT